MFNELNELLLYAFMTASNDIYNTILYVHITVSQFIAEMSMINSPNCLVLSF